MNPNENRFDLSAALKKLSDSDTGAPHITLIDIDLIDENEQNFYRLTDLDKLAQSIELEGLQQPLLVSPPDERGHVCLISGHRRRAAIASLVGEHPELRRVPCIERRYSSQAAAELSLILANSTARVLTAAETAKQAERVEALLCTLKKEGMNFPGKMREHVARACQISESKLARLKVIRSGLRPEFASAFERGKNGLSEQAAYEIARMPEEMQKMLSSTKKDCVIEGRIAERLRQNSEKYLASKLTCRNGSPCTNGERFLRHDAHEQGPWGFCRVCCVECGSVGACGYCCAAGKERQAKIRAEEARRKEKADAAAKAAGNAEKERISAWCRRVIAACEASGVKVADVIRTAHLTFATAKMYEKAAAENWDDIAVSEYYYLPDIRHMGTFCRTIDVSADYLLGLDPAMRRIAPEQEAQK